MKHSKETPAKVQLSEAAVDNRIITTDRKHSDYKKAVHQWSVNIRSINRLMAYTIQISGL